MLEERKIRRLGENISRDVDVRIIAMTNRNLLDEVAAGHFREDLYYRLSEFPIQHFPPEIMRGESLVQEVMQAIGQKTTRYRELVDRFEQRCIEYALRTCNGNRTQAAKMLGIDRKSLYEKMQRLQIHIPANT